jgi:hypothetical protein
MTLLRQGSHLRQGSGGQADRSTRVRSRELHFGVRTGTQPRGRFDERRATADVEERDRLTGTKDGVCRPVRPGTCRAAFPPAFNQIDR